MKKISIVIPVYNVEHYVKECLESIASQSYQDNVECILVDDGSRDKSVDIIEAFIEKYDGNIDFQLIKHEKNKGQAAARNTGLGHLSGDYVYFMDSDDVIEPTCLEYFIDVLRTYSDVDVIQAGMTRMEGVNVFSTSEYPDYSTDGLWIKKLFLLPDGMQPGPCNRLMKRDILLENNISFHEGIIYEDVPFTFKLGQCIKSIAFLKEDTYKYRIHEGSTITSSNDMKAMRCRLCVLDDILESFNDVYPVLQARALMLKIMQYYCIHSKECLKVYSDDLKKIHKKISHLMPWYFKPIAYIYILSPIALKKNRFFDKFFRIIFNIDIN